MEDEGYDPASQAASFPAWLIVTRRARGLTQKQLALELGVDPTTIRDWEHGEHEQSLRMKELLAKVLPAR